MRPLRTLFIAPSCDPHELIIDDDLESLQALVGGRIDAARLNVRIALYCNDDGLNLGLPPNLRVPTGALLVGNLVGSAIDDHGDSVDLTDADIVLIQSFVNECRRPMRIEYKHTGPIITPLTMPPPAPIAVTIDAVHIDPLEPIA